MGIAVPPKGGKKETKARSRKLTVKDKLVKLTKVKKMDIHTRIYITAAHKRMKAWGNGSAADSVCDHDISEVEKLFKKYYPKKSR